MPDANDTISTDDLSTLATVHIARSVVTLDLSGGAQADVIILHSERAATLTKATALYTEASSADAGVNISVGKEGSAAYYVAAHASETDKAAWYTKDLTLAQTAIAVGDTVTCGSAGAKVGTGEIIVVIEYEYSGGL